MKLSWAVRKKKGRIPLRRPGCRGAGAARSPAAGVPPAGPARRVKVSGGRSGTRDLNRRFKFESVKLRRAETFPPRPMIDLNPAPHTRAHGPSPGPPGPGRGSESDGPAYPPGPPPTAAAVTGHGHCCHRTVGGAIRHSLSISPGPAGRGFAGEMLKCDAIQEQPHARFDTTGIGWKKRLLVSSKDFVSHRINADVA